MHTPPTDFHKQALQVVQDQAQEGLGSLTFDQTRRPLQIVALLEWSGGDCHWSAAPPCSFRSSCLGIDTAAAAGKLAARAPTGLGRRGHLVWSPTVRTDSAILHLRLRGACETSGAGAHGSECQSRAEDETKEKRACGASCCLSCGSCSLPCVQPEHVGIRRE
jgi:hypothetical protein